MMPANLYYAELVGSDVEDTALFEQEDVWENPGYLLESNYAGVDKIALGLVNGGCPAATGYGRYTSIHVHRFRYT